MKRVGFLGCGKIGNTILQDILTEGYAEPSFIQDPAYKGDGSIPVIQEADEELLKGTDVVIESAIASVLKANIALILRHCDLMIFSVTSFADEAFYEQVQQLQEQYGHRVYLPHGAILGVDGISDGSAVITDVTVETIKNPKSLGRTDEVRTVVYEGSTRGACEAYPRNVNVHATVALSGVGFDKTQSRIISDPAVNTNSHVIKVEGEGIRFQIDVSSFANGGVTGKYTPYSAVGSARKVLGMPQKFNFV